MQQIKNKEQALSIIESTGKADLMATFVPVKEIQAVIQQIETLKKSLSLDDEVIYYGEDGAACPKGKAVAMYVPRKPLRTYMLAFNLSSEILAEEKLEGIDAEGPYYVWRYKVRVTMANGRFIDKIGACSSRDPFFSKKYGKRVDPDESDIIHKAMTAALNRGISDILGGAIPTEEDVRMRHLAYMLKKKAGATGQAGQEEREKKIPPGSQKTESATPMAKAESVEKLTGLMKNPVFTEQERGTISEWLPKPHTEAIIQEAISKTEKEIKARQKTLAQEQEQAKQEQDGYLFS